MIAAIINRKSLKREVRTLLTDAQVSPKAMVALYAGLMLLFDMLSYIGGVGFLSNFLSIFITLITWVLSSGFVLYCMAIRRGERSEFLTLFDGFSFAGKVIALNLVTILFISLWAMLFVFPGIVAAYRYRFALYNLYENPDISVFEALNLSKRQTAGYKFQLFLLDFSYIGWFLLAALPVYIESGFLAQEMVQSAMSFAAGGVMPSITGSAAYAVLPAWGWTLLSGIWSLVVGLFYMAHYQCVELGYFEIAKSTSGTRNSSQQDPWQEGPDNMGSL